jgi:hypothetical protein
MNASAESLYWQISIELGLNNTIITAYTDDTAQITQILELFTAF